MVLPGGKSQERRASRFSFFVYMTTRNGDPRARGSLYFTFFGILTTKPPGRFWGAGFSLPLGEPRNTCRILRQVVRGTEMRTPEKNVQL